MNIDIIELDEFIISNFIFHEYSIDMNENEIRIELTNESDKKKLIEYLESEYSGLYEIKSYGYDELDLEIKFIDEISYIDENEYIENMKSEIEYYESLIKDSGIFSDLNENEY